MTDPLTPVLTANWGDERAWKLTNYEHRGGYQALRSALQMEPALHGFDGVNAAAIRFEEMAL